MKSLQHSTLLLLSVLVSLFPAEAQVRMYQGVASDVPFQFMIGERSFRPGHYEFLVVGTGLLAMRDHHHRVVASLVTRSSEQAEPAPSGRLVFDRTKKKA